MKIDNVWLQSLLVAFLYLATASIGFPLGDQTSTAYVLWVPAGIALCSLLLWGPKMALAVAVGAFMSSAYVVHEQGIQYSIGTSMLLGIGAATQSLIGYYLTRKVIRLPKQPDNAGTLIKFFILGGPITCLFNATFSVAILWHIKQLPTVKIFDDWVIWWTGDVFGVVLVGAFLLASYLEPRNKRWLRYSGLLATAVFGLSISAAIHVSVHQTLHERWKYQTERQLDTLIQAFELKSMRYSDLLYATRALFTISKWVTRSDFRHYTLSLLEHYPGLEALMWIPHIQHQDRGAWEQHATTEQLPSLHFADLVNGQRLTATQRPDYSVIWYAEPEEKGGNRNALGIDISTAPQRLEWMRRAVISGKPISTLQAHFVSNESQGQAWVTLLAVTLPFHNQDRAKRGLLPRDSYLGAVVQVNDLLADTFRDLLNDTFNLVVFHDDGNDRKTVFEWNSGKELANPHKLAQERISHLFFEKPLTFRLSPNENFMQSFAPSWPLGLLLGGIFLTCVYTVVISIIMQNDGLLQKEVDVRRVAENTLSRINARLKEREIELESARVAAESSNAAKSAFIANVSHEIRTPLAAIVGFSDLISGDAKLTDDIKNQYRETIHRNGQLLCSIIDDILDLSKMEAGKLQIQCHSVNLADVLLDTTAMAKQMDPTKGLKVDLALADNIPQTIDCDEARLRQILNNLISNAVKFTAFGGIRIHARMAESDPMAVEILVEDSGSGIDPTKQHLLFQPFSQLDDTITRQFGGSGLGLAISKNLAILLGGTLELESSELGKGSAFKLTLPATGSTLTTASRSVHPAESTLNNIGGLKILLVEDSDDIRSLLTAILAEASVSTASNGAQGLEMALANAYDVILIDLQMPVMDGMQAIAKLREQGNSTPAIALTAHARKQDQILCMQNGFQGYLAKPVQTSKLFSEICRILPRLPLT